MKTEILMNVYVDNGKVHVFPLSTIIGAVASGTIALTFDSNQRLIKVRDWNAPADKVTIQLSTDSGDTYKDIECEKEESHD